MKKKFLAMLLALVMVLGLIPATAFAAAPVRQGTLEFRNTTAMEPLALPEQPAGTNGDYKVSLKVISGSSHGEAELGATSGNPGDEILFTAIPDAGYLAEIGGSYEYTYYEPQIYYVGYHTYLLIMGDGKVNLELKFVKASGENHSIAVTETVNGQSGDGGTVETNVNQAKEGESVFLAVTPDENHQLNNVFATDAAGNYVEVFEVSEEEGTVYLETFMPATALTVQVDYGTAGPFRFYPVLNGVRHQDKQFLEDETVKLNVLAKDSGYIGCAMTFNRVDIKATPKEGYKVRSVTSKDVDIIPDGENAWYFIMPNHEVTFDVVTVSTVHPVSVVVDTGIGGTASLDVAEAREGDTVTLTCTPGEGYRVAQITGAEVTDMGDGTYTFVMPEKAVELHVLFLRENNPFVDVNETHFFYAPVLWAVEEGITSGMDATHFGPLAFCNRAQVVTFLWRWFGCPEPTTTENPFTDVPADIWYTKPVLWAVENGITNGMGDGTFGVNLPCNRAQVVTFLYRALGSPEITATVHPFTDVPAGEWYEAPVLWAVEKGITTGATATTFDPNGQCMRAVVVTFLYRADQLPESAPENPA